MAADPNRRRPRTPPARGAGDSRTDAVLDRIVSTKGNKHPLVEAFCKKVVMHKRLKQLLFLLSQAIATAPFGAIILLLGPSGVGKSTLIRRLATEISKAVERAGTGDFRIALIELFAPEGGPFHWSRDLYEPLLRALREPCLNYKIDVARLLSAAEAGAAATLRDRSNPADRRDLLLKALLERNVRILFIDDAHHIRRGGSGASIYDRYSTLKSLAGITNTRIVLCGTSELKELLRQSGQLSRRVVPLYFLPYGTSESDRASYVSAVKGIVAASPLPVRFDLDLHIDELHQNCLGAVGVTHEWFQRAVELALAKKARSLSWRHLVATALTLEQRGNLAREIRELQEFVAGLRVIEPFDDFGSQPQEPPQAAKPKSLLRRPGKRKPARDRVPRTAA